MLLVKLGGSIITNKSKPLTPRKKTIDGIAKILARVDEPLVLVHGGGSFGHYWSVKYDMHTKPARYDTRGVAVVKNSMVDLNQIILESLLHNKLNPYVLPPTDFVRGDKPISSKVKEIARIAKSGLAPVTYGDALWYGDKKSYILSGDRIMSMLARILRPRLCMFVLDVDGLYSDVQTKELIQDASKTQAVIKEIGMDVTGGMKRKVAEAQKISKMGLKVFFVNGNHPKRILDAARGKDFVGTMFR